MKIAIVDDERPARNELTYLIRQCMPEAEIVEADCASKLMQILETERFDALFVDIDLGGENGTTLASMIRGIQPEALIVFATAYGEYAVRAFELAATDYLLKPFDLERVAKTVERLRKNVRPENQDLEIDKLMVSTGTAFLLLDVSEILYIETENRACRIHTRDGSYLQNEPLGSYEAKLKDKRFFRIHKSFLVNLEYVREMVIFGNNSYGLRLNGSSAVLPIGRTQLKEFRKLF